MRVDDLDRLPEVEERVRRLEQANRELRRELDLEAVQPQYQAELTPVRPHVTQFNVAVGRCRGCGRRVQDRHPLQTSDALGAAASQPGPRGLALAADPHTGSGLPLGRVSALLATAFGLEVTPGGLCLALHRAARRAEPTYRARVLAVRKTSVVADDETGWKVGGWLEWLWVFVTLRIADNGLCHPARARLRASCLDSRQELCRDPQPRRLGALPAVHRRQAPKPPDAPDAALHEILETAERGAARLPHAILRLLECALALRDRRDAGSISPHGLAVGRGRLEARMDRLPTWQPTVDANRKFVKHLRHERPALFTFLRHPEVEATNWWGEQAICPAAVTRKVCGGNRTWPGVHTQAVRRSRQALLRSLAATRGAVALETASA